MKLTDITPYLAECREALNPSSAEAVRRRENVNVPLLNEREVTRSWPEGTVGKTPIYKAFLEFYTDATNNQPRSYVDNPLVGQEELAPGRWRNAFVFESYDGDTPTINQTLRYGWIEKLVSGGQVDWSEARIVETEWYNGDGASGENDTKEDYHVIQWKGVSPFKSTEIVESLKELPWDGFNPVIRGNDLGSQKRLNVRVAEDQDGSHTIRMMLGNSMLVYESYQAWLTGAQTGLKYYFNVPTNAVPAIIELEREEGATARIANRPRAEGLCDITITYPDFNALEYKNFITSWNCRFKEYTTLHLGLSEEQMEAITLEEPPVGETHSLRRNFDGQSWTVEIRVTVRQSQTRIGDVVGDDEFTATTLDQYLGIDPTAIPVFPDKAGSVTRRRIDINEDCTLNVSDQNVDAVGVKGSTVGGTETEYVSEVRDGDRNQDQPVDQYSLGGGKITDTTSEKNEFGLWDTRTTERTAREVDDASKSKTTMPFEVRESVTNRNKTAPEPEPDVQIKGRVDEVRNDKNDFGLYDTTKSSRIATPQEAAEKTKRETKFVEEVGTTDRNQEERIEEQVAFEDGKIIQTSSVENEYGLFDNTENVSTAKDVAPQQQSKRIEAFQEEETEAARNLVAEPVLQEEQDAGVIKRLLKAINEFGRWDKEETTITATERTNAGAGVTREAFQVSETAEEQNVVVEPVLPTEQTAGTIKTLRKRLNAFLRWDVQSEERTSVERTDASEGRTHEAFQTTTETEKTNVVTEPVLPTEQTAGTIKTLRRRLNAFLRWDVQEQDRVAVEKSDAGAGRTKTTYEDTDEEQAQNLVGEPTLPTTTTAGVIKTLRKRLNAFLRWDKEEQTRTAHTVVDASKSERETIFEKRTSDTVRNRSEARDKSSFEGQGKVVTQTIEKSEFPDRVHDTIEVVEGKKGVSIDGIVEGEGYVEDAFTETEWERRRGREEKLDETKPQVTGEIHDVRNYLREDGLYDSESTKRTAVEKGDQASSGGPLVQVEEDFKRNASSPESPGQGEAGVIHDVSNSINEFGLYDSRKSTRTAVQSGPHESVFGGPSEQVEYETSKNLESIPTPGPGVGQIVNVSASVNEFGRFDATVTRRIPVNQQSQSQAKDYFSQATEDLNTQAEGPATLPVGDVASAENSPTPYGKYQTKTRTETPSPRTESFPFPRMGVNGTYHWGENASSLPVFDSGTNVTLSARRNKFGLLSYSATEIPGPGGGAVIRRKYERYDTDWKPFTQIIQRAMINGVPHVRVFTGNEMRAIGDERPEKVVEALAGANYKVSMDASADGRFFQGKGIKIGETTAGWVKDNIMGA